jgi:hypothetical protein
MAAQLAAFRGINRIKPDPLAMNLDGIAVNNARHTEDWLCGHHVAAEDTNHYGGRHG